MVRPPARAFFVRAVGKSKTGLRCDQPQLKEFVKGYVDGHWEQAAHRSADFFSLAEIVLVLATDPRRLSGSRRRSPANHDVHESLEQEGAAAERPRLVVVIDAQLRADQEGGEGGIVDSRGQG